MSGFKLERKSANQRAVVVQNGRTKQDVMLWAGDATLPVVQDEANLINEKVRAGLVSRMPEALQSETAAMLAEIAMELSALKALPDDADDDDQCDQWPIVDREKAYEKARVLLKMEDILAAVVKELGQMGVVGEATQIKLIFLSCVTRLLDSPLRPVSVIIKSISSTGKSYLVEAVLVLHPARAFKSLSGMSDRALVYDMDPVDHRMLVISEAAGMESDFLQYILRTLLSEGCLKYDYVDKDDDGHLVTKHIQRDGPTGLILTTTRSSIHPENETRMLSLTLTESVEQTRRVMLATAARLDQPASRDASAWHALQDWLSVAEHRVHIPYAVALAELADNRAVRMRRDLTTVFALITAHAILHQESRKRAPDERIIATFDDYAVVAELITEVISYGIQSSVPEKVRLAVEAVQTRCSTGVPHATTQDVAQALEVEKSAANKWVRQAVTAGYLTNQETRKHQPAKLTIGETPLPDDTRALPRVEDLRKRSAERPVRSAQAGGTPSDCNNETSGSVPSFRADFEGSTEVFSDGPDREKTATVYPPETPRNDGTTAQLALGDGVSVPPPNMERLDRSTERHGTLLPLTAEEYAEELRLSEELLQQIAVETAEREALEAGL